MPGTRAEPSGTGRESSRAESPEAGKETRQVIDGFLGNRPEAVSMLASWARSVAAHRAWGFELPEDIVQATLLALVRNLRAGRFIGGDLGAYVRTIAKNQCVSSYRKARTRRMHVSLEEHMVTASRVPVRRPSAEETVMADRILSGLDPACREMITLAYVQGLSRKEIADRLGIQEGAAKVRLFRCLERARALQDGRRDSGGKSV